MKKFIIMIATGLLFQLAYAQEESYLLDDGPPTEEQKWEGFENVEDQERQEYEGKEGNLQRQEEDVAPADPQFDPIDSDYRGNEQEGAWEAD